MKFDGFMRVGAFSLAMLLGFAAEAATLDVIKGGVLVSRGGSPYQLATKRIELRTGDSVLANPGGGARIVFSNGCAVPITPGMVFTVPEAPPCVANTNPTAEPAASGTSTMLAVGAAVVAGGVGLAIAASGGGGGGGSP